MPALQLGPVALNFEWWQKASLGLLLLQAVFAAVPRVRPGKAGLACWYLGSDGIIWRGLAGLLLALALAWSVWHGPFWTAERGVGFAAVVLLWLSPRTYRVYPSSHAGRQGGVRFRVPLDGPVTVAWGGDRPGVNYHVRYPDQRWAYDILATDAEGRTHRSDGGRCEDYYIYGRPLLAPAAGKVVKAFDGDPDMPIGQLGGGTDAGGNQVVLEVAPDEFLHMGHLKPGSVAVKEGDQVTEGQFLGLIGNSGNTSEPHLHIHLQDGGGEGIPLYFHGYRSAGRHVERGMPRGGFTIEGGAARLTGEVIEHAGSAGSGEGRTGVLFYPPYPE